MLWCASFFHSTGHSCHQRAVFFLRPVLWFFLSRTSRAGRRRMIGAIDGWVKLWRGLWYFFNDRSYDPRKIETYGRCYDRQQRALKWYDRVYDLLHLSGSKWYDRVYDLLPSCPAAFTLAPARVNNNTSYSTVIIPINHDSIIVISSTLIFFFL